MSNDLNWLNGLLAGYVQVLANGAPVKQRNILNLIGATPTDDPNYVDPTSGAVVGKTDVTISGTGSAAPFLLATLRSTLPATPATAHAQQTVDGFTSEGDGGQGVFVWDDTDTSADDGGTIIQVTSPNTATGRWRRVYSGPLNVLWFGADPTGAVGSSSAIQKAIMAALEGQASTTLLGQPIFSQASVYFPKGLYKIDAELQTGGYINLVGDEALLFTSSSTQNILRMGTPDIGVSGLQFAGGRSHIVFNGAPNTGIWGMGSTYLGNPAAGGTVAITRCKFFNAAGPALMQDFTNTGHGENRPDAAQLVCRECLFVTPCAYFGSFDQGTFEDVYVNANDQNVTCPVDGGGDPLGVFNSADTLQLKVMVGTPTWTRTYTKNPVWIQGCGNIKIEGSRFGGETYCAIWREKFTTAIAYNGNTLYVDPGTVPQFTMATSSPASSVGMTWCEIVDTFPDTFIIDACFGTPTGVAGSPPPTQDFYGSSGIWLNSSINLAALQSRPNLIVRCGDVPIGANAMRFYQSSAPGTFGVDVSSAIRFALSAGAETIHTACHTYPVTPASDENLFFSGVTDFFGGAWNIAGTGAGYTGTHLTTTGYSLALYQATADQGFVNFITTSGWNPAIPAGDYVFSFYMSDCNNAGEVLIGINTSSAITGQISRTYEASSRPHRIYVPFHYDGSTALYFSLQFLGLAHFLADGVTQSRFTAGLPMINRGQTPAPYVQPVDSAASPTTNLTLPVVVSDYYGAAAPSTGAYNVGDRVWNTSPTAGGTALWVCVTAPHTFKAVGLSA